MKEEKVANALLRVFAFILVFYFFWPLFQNIYYYGALDWDPHLFFHAAVIKSVFEFHSLPFWNLWYCGGNVLWANPQVPLLSPAYLFGNALPIQVAMKYNIAFHIFVSMFGMWKLLGLLLEQRQAPLKIFLASIFTFSGAIVLHVQVGHATFLTFYLMPLLLYYVFKLLKCWNVRSLIFSGALLALLIYNGGFYPFLMMALGLATFGTAKAIVERRLSTFFRLFIVAIVGLGLSAPKLIPVYEFMKSEFTKDSRLGVHEVKRVTSKMLKIIYTDPKQSWDYKVDGRQQYNWHEYGNYIGKFAALLFLLSYLIVIFFSKYRRNPEIAGLFAAGLLMFLLAIGKWGIFSPIFLINKLPIYEGLRVAPRYTIPFVLFYILLVASLAKQIILDKVISERIFSKLKIYFYSAAFVLFSGLSFTIAQVNRSHLADTFPIRLKAVENLQATKCPEFDNKTTPWDLNKSPMLFALYKNKNQVRCYDPFVTKKSADPKKQIIFANDEAVEFLSIECSPSTIKATVQIEKTNAQFHEIFLNQNYNHGWKSNIKLAEVKSLLSVKAPSETTNIEFHYTPPGLAMGCVIFCFTIALLFFTRFFVRLRK